MKLPPHILPTLNELSAKPKFADTVGFYVPHRGMEDGAGIYLPLPRAPNKSGPFKADGEMQGAGSSESEKRSGEESRDGGVV